MTELSPINKLDPALHLIIPPFLIHLLQYEADVSIPRSLFSSSAPFLSVTRSPGETTVLYGVPDSVTSSSLVDKLRDVGLPEPKGRDGPYAVLRVRGPLALTLTGILNELTTPLRLAQVPIYAVSTWDTDYVLVPLAELDSAREALVGAGWVFD